jgi:hypothetical protein
MKSAAIALSLDEVLTLVSLGAGLSITALGVHGIVARRREAASLESQAPGEDAGLKVREAARHAARSERTRFRPRYDFADPKGEAFKRDQALRAESIEKAGVILELVTRQTRALWLATAASSRGGIGRDTAQVVLGVVVTIASAIVGLS